MSFSIRRTIAARRDLDDLWYAIAIHDVAAADRQLDRIEAAIAGLAEHPFIGPSREDYFPGVRGILRSPYLTLYRVDEGQHRVDILRVVDARRDLGSLTRDL